MSEKQIPRPGEILFELPIQGKDRSWYLFGKKITDQTTLKDIKYSQLYWQEQDQDMIRPLRIAMKEAIKSTIQSDGQLSIFVNKDGINNNRDRQRLSAYRLMATCMGYKVGNFTFNRNSYTASAPVNLQ